MIDPPALPAEAEAAPQRPLLPRVRDTFFAPARLFASFGDRPAWIGVLALATAIAAVAVAAEPAEFYLSQMEDPVNRRGAPVEITSPPEQIVLWGRLMAIFSAAVGHPLLAFAGAGLLALGFRVIGRGQGAFAQYLAVASHGLLIVSVGMIVTVVLRAATGDSDMLPTVGALTAQPEAGWLGGVLHGLNLFTLWMLAVIAIGVATLERRVTRVRAGTLLWGAYGLLIVTAALLFHG